MDVEFDPAKDEANLAKHGVGLASGLQVFDDADLLVFASIRSEDGEERYKAIGLIDGKLWSVVHIWRGDAIRMISVRGSNEGEERTYNRHSRRS